MAWPTDQVATGELITAAQLNRLPIMLADTVVVGSAAASIDFTSIPAHWSHLIIELYARGDTAATSTAILMRFNNDTGTNYNYQLFTASNTTLTGATGAGVGYVSPGSVPAATAPANVFGAASIKVTNYANSENFKTYLGAGYLETADSGAGQTISQTGGIWESTAAINRVTLVLAAGSFAIGTRASVYGMGRI